MLRTYLQAMGGGPDLLLAFGSVPVHLQLTDLFPPREQVEALAVTATPRTAGS